jgi:hypothetical protein
VYAITSHGSRDPHEVERYQAGTNLVLLSPDVARHFPNEQSVNSALRDLIREKLVGTEAKEK